MEILLMKKRIFSYFLILFLSFIFLKSVYAEHYYFEKFNYFDTSEYSNFLNLRDHFKFINDYLNRVYLEKNIDVCFINSGYPAIICYSADLDNLHYNSNFIGSY